MFALFFVQSCGAIWLFELAWLRLVYIRVYRLEIISACMETVWQRETKAIHSTHCYQLICMDHNCTRLNSLFFLYTASSPYVRKINSFNKLICAIQIFMRKYFVVQHYPWNIFNIKLFPNYGKTLQFIAKYVIFKELHVHKYVHTYVQICTHLQINNHVYVICMHVVYIMWYVHVHMYIIHVYIHTYYIYWINKHT